MATMDMISPNMPTPDLNASVFPISARSRPHGAHAVLESADADIKFENQPEKYRVFSFSFKSYNSVGEMYWTVSRLRARIPMETAWIRGLFIKTHTHR